MERKEDRGLGLWADLLDYCDCSNEVRQITWWGERVLRQRSDRDALSVYGECDSDITPWIYS